MPKQQPSLLSFTPLRSTLATLVSVALLAPALAYASPAQTHGSPVQPGPGSRWRQGSEEIILIAEPGGDIDISVHPSQLTEITLPGPATGYARQDERFQVLRKPPNELFVQVKEGVPAGTRYRILASSGPLTLTIHAVVSDCPDHVPSRVRVRLYEPATGPATGQERPARPVAGRLMRYQQRILELGLQIAEKESALAEKESALAEKESALAEKDLMITDKERIIADQRRQLRQQKADFQRFETQVRTRELAYMAKLGYSESPVRTRIHAPGPVQLSGHKLARSGERAVLLLDLVNPSQAAQTIRAIELRDGTRGLVAPVAVYIGDAEQPASPGTVLAAESTTAAAIVVERAGHLEAPLRLSLRMQDESGAASEPETWFFPIEDMPPENVGKLSVHVQGIYGAIWLGHKILVGGVAEEKLMPTSLKGLGVRLTYGLTARLSFEAEVMGASSGEAEFQDVTVLDGQMMRMGDMYRSATLGRVQGGLLMRFGEDTFRPLVRLGLGLQGAGQSAEIVGADGVRTDGPEVGFALDGLWSIGTGLDVQLGNHVVAGLGLSAVFAAKNLAATGISGSFEAGLHLAYGWKPGASSEPWRYELAATISVLVVGPQHLDELGKAVC